MQSVQRQFGRFMKRSADDSQVAVLLSDFDQIDKLLDKVGRGTMDSLNGWYHANCCDLTIRLLTRQAPGAMPGPHF